MKDPKRVWAWVGVVIVVVIVVVWVVWRAKPAGHVSSNPAPVYAAQGQLVPQFPKNLILDTSAAITGSYSIGYASSTNQYTAEYNSSSTVTSLYNQYQSFLPQNGWTVNGVLTTSPSYDLISASQANSQLQVLISSQSGGSQVTITYLVK